MKNGLLGRVSRLETLRGCEVIDGRKHIYQSTSTQNERIKVGSQNAVDVSGLDKLCHSEMSPVDFCRVHKLGNQIATLAIGQFSHAFGICLFPGASICIRPTFLNLANEPTSKRNACAHRTAGTNQQRHVLATASRIADGLNNIVHITFEVQSPPPIRPAKSGDECCYMKSARLPTEIVPKRVGNSSKKAHLRASFRGNGLPRFPT